MYDATVDRAWPGRIFFGEPEKYPQYATDQEGWAITNDDDEFLESRDPSTIPRVEAPYTVQPGVTDDPHGPPGTNVQMETLGNYNRRIARDAKRSKKLWGEGIRGFGGEALETALTAKKYDARALFRKIKEVHGDKSAKQVSKMVRTFNARNKLPSEGIESFNNEWLSGLRLMKANNMELPEAYVVNLYMASLGDAYRMLESMVQVLPAKERTLQKVMKLAVDHRTDERDEADNSGIALAAEQTKKRKREQALSLRLELHRPEADARTAVIRITQQQNVSKQEVDWPISTSSNVARGWSSDAGNETQAKQQGTNNNSSTVSISIPRSRTCRGMRHTEHRCHHYHQERHQHSNNNNNSPLEKRTQHSSKVAAA